MKQKGFGLGGVLLQRSPDVTESTQSWLFDGMRMVNPNFGFRYLESVYPDLSLEEDRPLQPPASP